MHVRWTTSAAEDLVHIVQYIQQDNPDAARRVARAIYSGVAALKTSSHRGRRGLVENTRELIFTPWPYIAVYEIQEDYVHILRIRHASQLWP